MSKKRKKQQQRVAAPKPVQSSDTTRITHHGTAEPVALNDLVHEPPEPVAQRGSIPVWLIALIVLLLYWADMYVVTHGADLGGKGGAFPVTVYDPFRSHEEVVAKNPPEDPLFELGRRTFANAGCVACHQASGMGIPGQFPPLVGSEWVLTENPGRAIRIVLNGLTGPITVKGEAYNNQMPPLGLDAKQVAAVVTYIRKEWGNKASSVTVEQVEKVKQEIGGRTDMFTAAELEQVPAQ
jgi:mono/diheme cytochrome c family protein